MCMRSACCATKRRRRRTTYSSHARWQERFGGTYAPGAGVCGFTAVSPTEWWEQLVMAQAPRRRECTSTLFMLTCWMICKERNSRHFDHKT
jgi:hypothetical protein